MPKSLGNTGRGGKTDERAKRRHGGGEQSTRSPFQRDRDRLLYSDPFRRLAEVTQVVHVAEGHLFHNRLTHSLKVAQFGSRLAQILIGSTKATLLEQAGGLDQDVVETACLAHDLGHPPFGHIAEKELHDCLREQKIDDGYEGNAQSFRIVTKLAVRRSDEPGLNLCRATLNAILKYPWEHASGGPGAKKWGTYFDELDDFSFAREFGPAGKTRSIEAELMDWADDVTYAVHDVEDFFRAGIIPIHLLLEGGRERARFIEAVHKGKDRDRADAFFSGMAGLASKELFHAFSGTKSERGALAMFSTMLINRYILALKVDAKASVVVDETCRFEVDTLQNLMRHYVFNDPALVAQQFGQRRIVRQLFEMIFDAAQPNSATRGIVPTPFRDLLSDLESSDSDKQTLSRQRARLVADIVASLTEQQAIHLHQRLTGVSSGSVLDRIVR